MVGSGGIETPEPVGCPARRPAPGRGLVRFAAIVGVCVRFQPFMLELFGSRSSARHSRRTPGRQRPMYPVLTGVRSSSRTVAVQTRADCTSNRTPRQWARSCAGDSLSVPCRSPRRSMDHDVPSKPVSSRDLRNDNDQLLTGDSDDVDEFGPPRRARTSVACH